MHVCVLSYTYMCVQQDMSVRMSLSVFAQLTRLFARHRSDRWMLSQHPVLRLLILQGRGELRVCVLQETELIAFLVELALGLF